MKTKLILLSIILLLCAPSLRAQGTAFTYQGRLNENGGPANGSYDLRFSLRDAAGGGNPVGGTNTIAPVAVSNGLFTVTLDFGSNVFTGGERWLEIGVRSNGVAGAHTPLAPRQPLTPSPYAIFAGGAQTASTVATGGVSTGSIAVGAVSSSAIADGSLQTNDLSLPLLNSTFWRLDGNSGLGHFLGSTDFRPLEFRVNNSPALRLTPSPFGPNLIGGYSGNSIRGGVSGATIAGGGEPDNPNRIEQDYSVVGGGAGNTNSSYLSFIGGGVINLIQGGSGGASFIGGGQFNVIGSNGFLSVIAGGQGNVISNLARYSTISGGDSHVIETDSHWATIGGGRSNYVAGRSTTVGGGADNRATTFYSTVGGGILNRAAGEASVVAGGGGNQANGRSAFIGGGGGFDASGFGPYQNIANGDWSVVNGGWWNSAFGYSSAIGGGAQNTVQSNTAFSSIGGGQVNSIASNANHAFIGGGSYNTNSGGGAFIGGGIANRTENFDAIVVGGAGNVNAGFRSFIGGGEANSISNAGPYAMIGGGYGNLARGNSSTVGGGGFNSAGGLNATVPGGAFSDAQGDYSFASGRRAKAFHPGAFVWADSTDADFGSTLNNQFSVRAGGGVRVVTTGAGMTLDGLPVLSGTVGSAQLANGSVTAAKIPTGQVVKSLNSLTDNVTLLAGTNVVITPSGNTLQIAASFLGPVSDSQLSANIPRLNAAATFAGPVTANNAANSFNGAFTGNGGGLTNVNAATVAGLGAGSFWLTSGNAGTSAGANFVGTTDNQPLVLKVRNTEGFRIEPATNNAGSILPNIIGGALNAIQAGESGSIIAGGRENAVQSTHAVISGGWRNRIQSGSFDSVIVGGQANVISNAAPGATIGGGVLNSIGFGAEYAGIGNGRFNRIGADSISAVISGGRDNSIGTNASAATIAGGIQNVIEHTGVHATISGGGGNSILGIGIGATIGGGGLNRVGFEAEYAAISGGTENNAGGYASTIGGGDGNTAAGDWATVPGGFNNGADGFYSFAAGYRAKALHHGSFAWADISAATDFTSTAANQFLIRAAGGVGIGTPNPAASLHLYSAINPTVFRIQSTGTPGFGRVEFASNPQGDGSEWRPSFIQSLDAGGFTGGLGFYVNGTGFANRVGEIEVMRLVNNQVTINAPATLHFGAQTRQMINLWGTQYGIGVQSSTTYFRTDNSAGAVSGFAWYKGGVHNDGAQNPGGGATMMRLDGAGLTVNGVFVSSSDRNLKENFAPVSPRDVLAKVAALPISSWNFKGDAATPHVGPMAQDFHAAFGLGTDDKHIATVDADGVALAAIQGLNQKLEEQRAENAELKQRLDALEKIIRNQKSN